MWFYYGWIIQPSQWGSMVATGQRQILDKSKTRNLKQIKRETRRMQTGQQLMRQKTKHTTEKRKQLYDIYNEKNNNGKQNTIIPISPKLILRKLSF